MAVRVVPVRREGPLGLVETAPCAWSEKTRAFNEDSSSSPGRPRSRTRPSSTGVKASPHSVQAPANAITAIMPCFMFIVPFLLT